MFTLLRLIGLRLLLLRLLRVSVTNTDCAAFSVFSSANPMREIAPTELLVAARLRLFHRLTIQSINYKFNFFILA